MPTPTENTPAGTGGETLKHERDRFFALAFCWADILLELDGAKTILFASGATLPILGEEAKTLVGRSLTEMISPADRVLIDQTLALAEKKGRLPANEIRLQTPAGVACYLEIAGHALHHAKGHIFLALRISPKKAGVNGACASVGAGEGAMLHDPKGFGKVAGDLLNEAKAKGDSAEMTLISVPDLGDLEERLSADDREHLKNTVNTCLKANSLDGNAAGEMGDGKFGLVHGKDVDITELQGQLEEAARSIDPTGQGVGVETATMDADFPEISEQDLAKGIVYAISQFRDSSGEEFSFENLKSNLTDVVREAANSVNSFREMSSEDKFDIVFHPILDTVTGHCHHYEALVRFGQNLEESPYRYITFAEETGLISEFDISMARKAVHWLAQHPTGKESLAVNISGNSVANDMYVEQLLRLLEENTWLRGRMMFEITESSRMADLDAANAFIQKIRERGYPVCLDDFGAGAASFQYLSTLEVDVVKLDGSAVKNAQKAKKGTAFLVGLTGLCKNMNVKTIAEMVDTPDTLTFVRNCGVEFAQGYLFGKPNPEVGSFRNNLEDGLFENKKVVSLNF